ncbi:MAG: hypothetical protein KJ069_24435 [Anaerolineae bacterium]|nr:hypothetical protein [Anaerolineae bacterium]
MLAQIQLDSDLVASLEEVTQRQGENVEEVLTELVQQYLRQARRDKIRREMAWYQQSHAALKTSYLGEHVAIHEGQVVDHDKDVAALAQRIRQRYGRMPILITQITADPVPEFTIRRPRLVQTT